MGKSNGGFRKGVFQITDCPQTRRRIASEVSILSKNSLAITDFHVKTTQHVQLFENALVGTPPFAIPKLCLWRADEISTSSHPQEQIHKYASESESFRQQLTDTLQGIYDSITGEANATMAKMETASDDAAAAGNTSSASLMQLKVMARPYVMNANAHTTRPVSL